MKEKVRIIYPKNNIEVVSLSPALGPMYITSYLREKDIDTHFYDFNLVKNWKKKIYEIIDESPTFIGLSSSVSNYTNTQHLARFIKSVNSDIKIVVGGPYPSCVPEKYLDSKYIDYLIKGEGEITFHELVTKGTNIPGVMIKKNGDYLYGGDRPLIQDLDALPFPAIDDVSLKKYWFIFFKKSPISNIVTSRGCPYNCTFCFHGVHGYKWRARSPKSVFKELKWQTEELGVRELSIWDDNFTLDTERVDKITNLIIKNDLDVLWQLPNGIRVDRLNKNTLRNMKNSGCWSVTLAPETGDPYILKKINKGFTLETVKRVRKWCKELELFTLMYLMMGFPYEKMEHVTRTYQFIKEVKPEVISIHKFYPFPNTPIVEEYNLESYEGGDYRTAKVPKDFDKMFRKMYREFYINPANVKDIVKHLKIKATIKCGTKYILTLLKNKFISREYLEE